MEITQRDPGNCQGLYFFKLPDTIRTLLFLLLRLGVVAGAADIDHDARFVPDDPGVVAGRY